VPVPSARGKAPNNAAIVVIGIGRKRNRHASKIASYGIFPSLRCACRAKSIIMMAFFFTMPMIATTLSCTIGPSDEILSRFEGWRELTCRRDFFRVMVNDRGFARFRESAIREQRWIQEVRNLEGQDCG